MATKLIVMTGFLIAFAAGLVTGMQNHNSTIVQQVPPGPRNPQRPTTTRQVRPPAYFIEQLHLTHDQTDQWNKIWSEVADRGGRGQQDKIRQLRQKRDADLVALIPEASRTTYEKILKDFSDSMEQMDKDWRDSYDDAVVKTKGILNDSQRQTYETILKRNDWDRGRGGRGGTGGNRGPGRGSPRGGQFLPNESRDEKPRQTGESATRPAESAN